MRTATNNSDGIDELTVEILDWQPLPDWVHHSGHWFVMSDTHGDYPRLEKLLEQVPKGAAVIHLGDIGDRGDMSVECYRLIDEHPDILLIRGNHDMFLWDCLFRDDLHIRHKVWRIWMYNGGWPFAEQIKEDEEVRPVLLRVLMRQKLYHFDGNLFFVHAGLRSEQDFEILSKKKWLDLDDWNVRYPDLPEHLSWSGDGIGFFDLDEKAEWEGFPVKPFFVHGHRRCSALNAAAETVDPLEKLRVRPRIDTWRIGVDTHVGLNAVEIREGMFRFYEVP